MLTKKELKELDKDIVRAIEWAATEYKYVQELKGEIDELEKGATELNERYKGAGGIDAATKIHKAKYFLRYLGNAERRAFKFEEAVERDLKEIYTELGQHTNFDFTGISQLMKELRSLIDSIEVSHNFLVEFASRYGSLLFQEVSEAEAEVQLLADIEKEYTKGYIKVGRSSQIGVEKIPEGKARIKAEKIVSSLKFLFKKIQEQIGEIDKWVKGLEAALMRARDIESKLLDMEREGDSFEIIELNLGDPEKLEKIMKIDEESLNEIKWMDNTYRSSVALVIFLLGKHVHGKRIIEVGPGGAGHSALEYLRDKGIEAWGIDVFPLWGSEEDPFWKVLQWENIAEGRILSNGKKVNGFAPESVDIIFTTHMCPQPWGEMGNFFGSEQNYKERIVEQMDKILKSKGIFFIQNWQLHDFYIEPEYFTKRGYKHLNLSSNHTGSVNLYRKP